MNDEIVTEVDPKEEPKKRCFIITPVGPDNSEIRRAANGVIHAGILPVLKELDFEADIPHEMLESGSITKAVINKIIDDDLVIANLTGLNANVMYELGIRHSAKKPVIHIHDVKTSLPFDIAPERALKYTNDMFGIQEFKPKLKSFIEAAMQESEPSNPVYDAIQAKSIMKDVGKTDPMKYLLKSFDELKNGIIKTAYRNDYFDSNERELSGKGWRQVYIGKVKSKEEFMDKLYKSFNNKNFDFPIPDMRIRDDDNQTVIEFKKTYSNEIDNRVLKEIVQSRLLNNRITIENVSES